MKKVAGILVFGFILFFTVKSCKTDGIRFFYCLSGDKCVTVWKTGNGEVYIIPRKYEGKKMPNISYIKTINEQFITLYFSKDLPNKIIVRDEGNLMNNKKMYSIENRVNGEWEFLEYCAEFRNVLYYPNATKFNDVKLSVDYLMINIGENYATDKTGKKLE